MLLVKGDKVFMEDGLVLRLWCMRREILRWYMIERWRCWRETVRSVETAGVRVDGEVGRRTLLRSMPTNTASEEADGGGRRCFFFFSWAWAGTPMVRSVQGSTGLDKANILWYGGCVGVWCERADMTGGPRGRPRGLEGSKHAGGSLAGMLRLIVGKCVYLDNEGSEGRPVAVKEPTTGRHQNNNSEAKC